MLLCPLSPCSEGLPHCLCWLAAGPRLTAAPPSPPLPRPGSGHFHLSHNYADAISVVGGTAFVLTGVIGECNRDGFRHSRVLKGAGGRALGACDWAALAGLRGSSVLVESPADCALTARLAPPHPGARPASPPGDAEGYRLYTMDHESGELRLDLQHRWDDASAPQARPSACLGRSAASLPCGACAYALASASHPRAARQPTAALSAETAVSAPHTAPLACPLALQPITPEEELICDPSAGWLCSKVDCSLGCAAAAAAAAGDGAASLAAAAVEDAALHYGRLTLHRPCLTARLAAGARWSRRCRTSCPRSPGSTPAPPACWRCRRAGRVGGLLRICLA